MWQNVQAFVSYPDKKLCENLNPETSCSKKQSVNCAHQGDEWVFGTTNFISQKKKLWDGT